MTNTLPSGGTRPPVKPVDYWQKIAAQQQSCLTLLAQYIMITSDLIVQLVGCITALDTALDKALAQITADQAAEAGLNDPALANQVSDAITAANAELAKANPPVTPPVPPAAG